MRNVNSTTPVPPPGKPGRPSKGKGPLRNFYLTTPADAFLADEHERSGRTMVSIVQAALLNFSHLKSSERDAFFRKLHESALADRGVAP